MGWFDWVRETAGKVGIAISTGLRGIIGLPEEIEPYLPSRPATQEQIREAMDEAAYAERFIQEALPEEARRLSRGVRFYEPLKNVARLRHWTVAAPGDIPASPDYQISVREVYIAPDGKMTHVDVSFPTGEKFTEDEFTRRAASALDNDFTDKYKVGRSQIVKDWAVARDVYIQRYTPLKR